MTTDTITVNRETVESFILEVDALAIFDSIRNHRQETALETHVYEIIEQFERDVFGEGGEMFCHLSEERGQELHDRARARAEELAREWFGYLFEREEVLGAR